MATLEERLKDIANSSLDADHQLLGLCKEMVAAISDLTRIVTIQGKTITILSDTVTTHNRILTIHNAINKVQ